MKPKPQVLSAKFDAYELVDCGEGQKLERFGNYYLIRSEPKAWWSKDSSIVEWKSAHATCPDKGKWILHQGIPRSWELEYDGISFEARLTDMSKHVGLFPEQQPHWDWINREVGKLSSPRVLNLFGYTGAASLVAAKAGAEVTHVDASKPSLSWARHNQSLSKLNNLPIRWLLDDAFKFVLREVRRKRQYEFILLDPPSFGRGPKGEIWKVEEQIVDFLQNLKMLLNPQAGRLVLTMYNLEASSLMLFNLVRDVFEGGEFEYGELAPFCETSQKYLPLSLFTRWKS